MAGPEGRSPLHRSGGCNKVGYRSSNGRAGTDLYISQLGKPREWFVYSDTAYYPSYERVLAVSPEQAVADSKYDPEIEPIMVFPMDSRALASRP